MTTALYVPGTSEKDMTKVIMSAQLVAGQTATNTDTIATNTTAIAAINASRASASTFGLAEVDGTTIKATAGVLSQTLSNATSQASPSNPAATTSTTGVMMGLGASCALTPVYGSRIKVEFNFTIQNTGTSVQNSQLKFGTGTAPINGAAATGTNVGKVRAVTVAVAGAPLPMTQSGIITGLTPGTAYWFDLDIFGSANTTTIKDVDFNAMEF